MDRTIFIVSPFVIKTYFGRVGMPKTGVLSATSFLNNARLRNLLTVGANAVALW